MNCTVRLRECPATIMGSLSLHHTVGICELARLLKFACNPQITTQGGFVVVMDMHRAAKNLRFPHACSQLRTKKAMLCLLVWAQPSRYKLSFWRFILCRVFYNFMLFVAGFHCFKWPPSVVLKCCLVFLGQEGRVPQGLNTRWRRLRPGNTHSAVGCEVNGKYIKYGVFIQKHT